MPRKTPPSREYWRRHNVTVVSCRPQPATLMALMREAAASGIPLARLVANVLDERAAAQAEGTVGA